LVCMFEVVLCAPEATVDVHNDWPWFLRRGHPHIRELQRMGAVVNAEVDLRRFEVRS
jgi:hypothetical protein